MFEYTATEVNLRIFQALNASLVYVLFLKLNSFLKRPCVAVISLEQNFQEKTKMYPELRQFIQHVFFAKYSLHSTAGKER